MKVRNNLWVMRNKALMTQEQLSQKTGIRRYLLSYYETGREPMSMNDLRKICKVLKCNEGDIYAPDILKLIMEENHARHS